MCACAELAFHSSHYHFSTTSPLLSVRVNLPFLREFNFCNVAQTVVDQVLDHILPQMTLNILGKQSMSYLI